MTEGSLKEGMYEAVTPYINDVKQGRIVDTPETRQDFIENKAVVDQGFKLGDSYGNHYELADQIISEILAVS